MLEVIKKFCTLRFLFSLLIFVPLQGCLNVEEGVVTGADIGTHSPVKAPPLLHAIDSEHTDDVAIFLTFSGGGTRASAFAHGVLLALNSHTVEVDGVSEPLTEKIKVISGISGGSVTAANFGLYGAEGLQSFRERFLLQDVEKNFSPSYSVSSLLDIILGGVNRPEKLAQWLDEHLFFEARIQDILRPDRPITIIGASDLTTNAPFFFTPFNFGYLCSDIRKYPLSYAVSASAAFPVLFKPLLLASHVSDCQPEYPSWLFSRSEDEPIRDIFAAYADSLKSYQDREHPFIRLVDGGVAGNLGIQALLLSGLSEGSPHHPLTKEAAVKLKNVLVFVADAQEDLDTSLLNRTAKNPKVEEFLWLLLTVMIDSASDMSSDLLRVTLEKREKELIRYRCSLPTEEVFRIRGTLEGWDCKDFKFQLARLRLKNWLKSKNIKEVIPTSFTLSEKDVDLSIQAGWDLLTQHPLFRSLHPSPRP